MKHLTIWFAVLAFVGVAQAQEDLVFFTQLTNTGGEPVELTFTVATAGAIFTAVDTTDAAGGAITNLTVPAVNFLGAQVGLSFYDCNDSLFETSAFLMPLDSVGGGLMANFMADYCPNDNPGGGGGGDPVVEDNCELDLGWSSADGMWFDFYASGAPTGADVTWSINGAVVSVSPDTVMSQGFDFTPEWVVCASYESDSCGTIMDCVTSDEAWNGGGGVDSLWCDVSFELAQALGEDSLPVPGNVVAWLPETDLNANYYWDFGDESYSTEATPSHVYSGNGPYLLCLTVVYPETPMFPACTAIHCDTISIDDAGMLNGFVEGFTLNVQVGEPTEVVGIGAELNAAAIHMFPNPVERGGTCVWTSEGAAIQTAEIYSITGQRLSTIVLNGQSSGTLNTAQLPAGSYIARFLDASGSATSIRISVK